MTNADSILLKLLRVSIGNEIKECGIGGMSADEWKNLIDLSFEQGVHAVSVDGYNALTDSVEPGTVLVADESLEDLKLEWFGSVLEVEEDARRQERAIASLARAYSEVGIKVMILKGYGTSFYYPDPLHRPTGDIDLYLFGDWKRGDELMRSMGIKVSGRYEHHTTFHWEGFTVENHYDFINTKAHKDAFDIDAKLKELVCVGAKEFLVPGGSSIYLPSPDFNVIFLIRHLGQHFAGNRVMLRHLLDWGLFLQAEGNKVNWKEAVPFLKKMGIWRFFNGINAVCEDYLGIQQVGVPEIERDGGLEKRILEDIMHPEFCEEKPENLIPVLWLKMRRWWCNRWKHEIVYDEWWLPMFLTLLWSHLKRLDTIKD